MGLWLVYSLESVYDGGLTFLGIFSSEEKAKSAIEQVQRGKKKKDRKDWDIEKFDPDLINEKH